MRIERSLAFDSFMRRHTSKAAPASDTNGDIRRVRYSAREETASTLLHTLSVPCGNVSRSDVSSIGAIEDVMIVFIENAAQVAH